jgi:transcriptional regulator with XRE-family HTH domain
MQIIQTIEQWMKEKRMTLEALEEKSQVDHKVLEAIVQGRYTPSPQQRQRVARALSVTLEQICWGHANLVSHLYGHGLQFGRSP